MDNQRDLEAVDILVLHGWVLTMDPARTVLDDGAVAICGSRIVAVGSTAELAKQYRGEKTVDVTGKLVMPGLINTHTHSGDSLFRGLVEDLPLEAWLARLWIAEEEFLTAETVRSASTMAYIEMLKAGTTLAVDMFWYPEVLSAAAEQVGFRLMTGQALMDPGAPDGIPTEERIVRAGHFLKAYRDHPLIIPCVAPHSVYTVTPAQLEEAGQLARDGGAIVTIHASETETEVNNCLQQYGVTPIQLLDRLRLLSESTLLAHCVHLEEDEFELLHRRGCAVAHCPASNLKIASGIANLSRMREAGVKITLGTDGPVSGNDLNPWFTLRLAAILQKGHHRQSSLFPAADMVAMMTCDAAAALHLGDRLGSLEPGKLADLITIRIENAHSLPWYDPYALLVYSTGREDVDNVIVNGRLVVHDRRLTTMDEAQVLARVKEIGYSVRAFMRGR